MLETFAQADQAETCPPYNIEKIGDGAYHITLAVGWVLARITLDHHAAKRTCRRSKHGGLHRAISLSGDNEPDAPAPVLAGRLYESHGREPECRAARHRPRRRGTRGDEAAS